MGVSFYSTGPRDPVVKGHDECVHCGTLMVVANRASDGKPVMLGATDDQRIG